MVSAYSPVSADSRRCDTIYRGFAECLLKLGESMTHGAPQGAEEEQELDTVCKSWDDFHACANEVLVRCPTEAATIWESLRKESEKMQFQGNLYELCSMQTKPSNSIKSLVKGGESNKETLRSSAIFSLHHSLSPVLLVALLVTYA
ncbi:neuritin 1-like a [Latimeria chalumnae]|uniref:neuritin 1-like a n=1 Tax=Latimeria chalumnae TaxID=7897 RepID=UPI0003C101D6|nr:PREDICTED: neuritin-like protein [Latimeria chalumnae]|eukprot:XP_005992872.1 PREDICTED: neuritin-like protein [Latimeria chalumnae]